MKIPHFFWEIGLKTNSLEHHLAGLGLGASWRSLIETWEDKSDKFSSFLRAQDISHFLQCSVGPLPSGVPVGIRCPVT